jgi:hypothetical protein
VGNLGPNLAEVMRDAMVEVAGDGSLCGGMGGAPNQFNYFALRVDLPFVRRIAILHPCNIVI